MKEGSLRAVMKKAIHIVPSSVLYGVVVAVNPVQIQVSSDAKLLLTESNLYIPKHLTNYKVRVDLPGGSGSTGTSEGHSHSVSNIAYSNDELTVKNALKVNDEVFILSFNEGQLYFVLDRVG